MSEPISGLPTGVPNGLLEIPATNPLVPTESPQGTTFKYIFSDLQLYLLRAEGFDVYDACVVATTANLSATYSNGTAGVGATLTNSGTLAALTIDSIALSVDDRVLVKDQASTFENGIYVVTTVGSVTVPWVLTRATDYNEPADIIYLGVIPINRGTVNSGLIYQENSTGPFVIGTSPITFQQLAFPTSLLPPASPPNKMLRSDGTYWVQSTNSELNASDALSGLTQLDVDNIRINGNSITSTDANGDINITPNGTGDLVLDNLNWPQADGTLNQALTTNGAAQLGWSTVSLVTTPTTINAIARYSNTSGALKNSVVITDDAGVMTGGTWQGNTVGVAYGGTGNTSVGANGTLAQSDGTKYTFTTATYPSTATATGTILRADGTNWVATTATYPATTTINRILYSSNNNVIGEITTANGSLLVTNSTGVPSMLSNPLADYKILLSQNGNAPIWSTAAYPQSAGALGTILRSDGTNWVATTATYPNTTSVNHILYSSAANVIGEIADTIGGVLVSNNTGVPSMLANPSDNYRMLQSKNAAIPEWSVAAYPHTAGASGTLMQSDGTDWTNTQATYPSSTNKDHILYSSANNTVGEIATQKDAVLVSNHSNTPVWSSSMTDGQIIIGKTNDIPAAANLTAGTGISITNGNNSITITNTAPSTVTPAALTRVDDTNVTLTLGGTPATALLQATSITAGWSGQLAVSRGGTGLSSATAYAVICGGTTSTGAFQSVASVGTAGQVLTSNGAGALPTFQTPAASSLANAEYTLMLMGG